MTFFCMLRLKSKFDTVNDQFMFNIMQSLLQVFEGVASFDVHFLRDNRRSPVKLLDQIVNGYAGALDFSRFEIIEGSLDSSFMK